MTLAPEPEGASVRPLARTSDLVVTEVAGDTLVYDLRSNEAHSLDAHAAALWRLCDGTRDVAALVAAYDRERGDEGPLDERVVRYALARLARAHLVTGVPAVGRWNAPLSRRALFRAAAATGVAVVVPTILSVAAPTTLYAMTSCRDQPCVTDADCCPGSRCVPNANSPRQPFCI